MADRYTYVPLIGVFVALVWGIAELLLSDVWRRAAAVAACAVIIVLSLGTRTQVGYWRNPVTLFRHCAGLHVREPCRAQQPGVGSGHRGQDGGGHQGMQAGVIRSPRFRETTREARRMLASNGQIREGMEECQKALQIDPDLALAITTLP